MTASTTSVNKIKILLKKATAIIFLIAVWQGVALLIGNATVLPTPIAVFLKLLEIAKDSDFWLITLLSCIRIIAGFLLGSIIGAGFGALSHISKTAKYLLDPLLILIKATPVASFIILLFFWLPNNTIPSFTSILIVIPLVASNVYEGFCSVDVGLKEVANLYNIRGFARFRALYLPTLKSYFLAAFSTSLGLSFKAGIAAEILCTPKTAIGSEIYNGKVYLETENVFAWTFVVIVLSLLFEVLFKKLLERGAKNA